MTVIAGLPFLHYHDGAVYLTAQSRSFLIAVVVILLVIALRGES